MKSKLALFIFLLAIGGSASAQLVLPICSATLPCPGFPLGSVQAPIDQNGWRNFKVTLTSNVTSFSFVGIPPTPAQASVNVIFTQDATGGRTVTFAAGITSSCTVTATANSTTLCQFEYDGVAATWFSISGGGVGVNTPANTSYYYLSKNCVGLTNCTQVFADTQFIIDATSNSTTTVTCPNSDCNFTTADVGKTVWATTQGAGSGQFEQTTLVCPVTTIASINSAQSITLNLTCTASGTANVVLIWGHRDGATLHALDGNGSGCVTIQPFSGAYMMVDQAEFIVPPTCAVASGSLQPLFSGRNWGAVVPNSAFIMTPDFNWSTCTGNGGSGPGAHVCFMSGMGQVNDLFIWGTGLQAGTNANCNNAAGATILTTSINGGSLTGLNIAGICPGTTGNGVYLQSIDEFWVGGGAQYVLNAPCVANAVVFTQVIDCRADAINSVYGLTINGGGYVTDISSWPFVGVVIFTGGTLISRGSHFSASNTNCGLQVQGTWISYGDFVGIDAALNTTATASAVCTSVGGVLQMINTKMASNNASAKTILFQGGTLISGGGNTVTGPVSFTTNAPVGESGWDILQGSCTGTVTSATTVGLFNLGNYTATTCTSTTTNLGPVQGKAGTGVFFTCTAGTAGNQAADACTVMKNNVATSMTCSLNGATFCMDGATAHQFSYAVGDIITVEVIAGTGTTLANVKASVAAW